MAINMTEDEIELKLRDFFEENFEFLKDSSGHSIDSYMKEKAFQQVLYYWKKNRALIERITRSEVKLSLPEQKMKVSKGANRNNMYKYMCARAEDQDDFVNGNLVIDN